MSRFCGRYWEQSGHAHLHRLMTQSDLRKIKRAAPNRAALSVLPIINRELVDDLHHTSSARLNENRMVVNVGVPVARHVILGRHLIIGDTLLR